MTGSKNSSIQFLSGQKKDLLASLAKGELLWIPTPGPQTEAYWSTADELYYGGAAGGGKTDLLLGLATTVQRRSIIFRREFAQLTGVGGLIERSRELLQNCAQYNGLDHSWRWIPGGRSLEFGGMQRADDWVKYSGRPHDFYGFDELPEFLELMYRQSIAWARTTTKGQRVRVVGTGNPPTREEGEWILRYWGPWLDENHPNPAAPGELRWFAVIDGEDVELESGDPFEHGAERITPKSRTFIPARLADNPWLAEGGYETILQNLPEPLRSQLLYGDMLIGRKADPWQLIKGDWVRAAQDRHKERGKRPEGAKLSSVGVDSARGGDDRTAFCRLYAGAWAEFDVFPGSETPDSDSVVARLLNAIGDDLDVRFNVDSIGIGAAVYDALKRLKLKKVRAVNFAEKSAGLDRSRRLQFRNVRAEAYWRAREALDPEAGGELALPVSSDLHGELVAPHWELGPSGIQIEKKEKIQARLGRSPDLADALALALLMPKSWVRGKAKR